MNTVVYHVGNKETTSYAQALILKEQTGLTMTVSYERVKSDYNPQDSALYELRMMKRYGENWRDKIK